MEHDVCKLFSNGSEKLQNMHTCAYTPHTHTHTHTRGEREKGGGERDYGKTKC